MGVTANALQILGLFFIVVGAFVIASWLGFLVAGIGCLAVGISLER